MADGALGVAAACARGQTENSSIFETHTLQSKRARESLGLALVCGEEEIANADKRTVFFLGSEITDWSNELSWTEV